MKLRKQDSSPRFSKQYTGTTKRALLSKISEICPGNSGMQVFWVLTCTRVNFSVVQLSMSYRRSCQYPSKLTKLERNWSSGMSSMSCLGWIDICSCLPSKSEAIIRFYFCFLFFLLIYMSIFQLVSNCLE